MKRIAISTIMILLAAAVSSGQAEGIPQMINYQGILLDGDGKPVTGNRSVEFLMYETETGGSALWSETQNITLAEGLFSVLLGSVTPIPSAVFDSTAVYLTLKVGSDGEMTPRKRLVSAVYSYRALEADRLGGHAPEDFVRGGEPGSVTAEMLVPSFLGSVDGVSNAGGNVDLVAGSNVTITPNDASNTITISASGGGTGDNLGNHTATQNIQLNGHWLSNDGGDDGLHITDGGTVLASGIHAFGSITVDGGMDVISNIKIHSFLQAYSHVLAGYPSSSYGEHDVAADDDVLADDMVESGGNMKCGGNLVVDGSSALVGNVIAGGDVSISGRVGIRGVTSPTYSLRVAGDAYCTGSWLSSDLSLKKNVAPAGSASKLLQLRGVSFQWRREEHPEREFAAGTQYGLIAQEVEAVYPELVKTDEKGEKAVNYDGLIPLLIEMVKEQQKTIDELKTQVGRLTDR